MRLLAALFCVVALTNAIFEDQAGKYDWRHRMVGCPAQVSIDRGNDRPDHLLVSTRSNAFAAISLNTGKIVWRRLQEEGQLAHDMPFALKKRFMYTIAHDGRAVRTWDKRSGALKWDTPLGQTASNVAPALSVVNEQLVVSAHGRVVTLDDEGAVLWEKHIGEGDWTAVLSSEDGPVVVSARTGQLDLHAFTANGDSTKKTIPAAWASKHMCVVSGGRVACVGGSDLHVVDSSGKVSSLPLGSSSVSSPVSAGVDGYVAVHAGDKTVVVDVTSAKEVLRVSRVDAVAAGRDGREGVVMFAGLRGDRLEMFERGGKSVYKGSIPSSTPRSPPSRLYLHASVSGEWQVVVIGDDCRVEMMICDVKSGASPVEEWSREESLAGIVSVEMVDVPLSDTQAAIESEFSEHNGNLVETFIRRMRGQAELARRWLSRTVEQMFDLGSILSGRGSFSDLVSAMRGGSFGHRGTPLERDYFNMRRMVVVATDKGTLFGLDNSDGGVVWRVSLGGAFSPLYSADGQPRVPLFIQRSSALYQYKAQAAVVFKDKISQLGRVVSFNPIDGSLVERVELRYEVRKADVLPSAVGEQHIHSVLVIGKGGEVSLHPAPAVSALASQKPVHVLLVDDKQGAVGYEVDLSSLSLSRVWQADLQLAEGDRIVAVKGKPSTQRVHSQGRVLMDRSVSYKYANPNLVAVAVLNEQQQAMRVWMIDAVSGQVVHSARLPNSAGPVHLVHCEHWLAYAYWNSKARRTEIGVLELYEGEEQTDADKFDSLRPPRRAPHVLASSYIFAHGVNAMAVSETEQGLSNRAILLALPIGGIFEVNRRFVDATRPLEVTQEMREEMIIPYMPEIAVPSEDMLNYNQTVHHVRGIVTAPSGLESTSLMLAYGIDVFYTRLHPSGTFDILKEDFDYAMISLVLIGLFVGSYVCKRIARGNALKQAWA